MKNKIASMNTDKLGLSEEKANEYVNSLVPKDNDVVSIAKQQVNEMYEKYNIPIDEREIKSCSYKNKARYDPFVVFIWSLITIGTILWTWGLIHLIQKAL
jgi:hypothetical protein